MKKTALILLAAMLALLALGAATALAEEAPDELDDWTVLFYFCGSDLESKYGYATGNLQEISSTFYPDNFLADILLQDGIAPDEDLLKQPGNVNVLIETGGSTQWHTEDEGIELNMNVDPNALQRWSFNTYSMIEMMGQDEEALKSRTYGFELLQTLPLQDMADPETLADFIRWGVQTKPAKKYALVLWDHGDGARSGLFIDELFDRSEMYLYELRQALADGGAHFEAVIIDACLMANIETAWSLKEYANWMAASEETVPGKGTAIAEWLQQLRTYPECDGEWLCRQVCDSTSVKYANEESEQAKSILTWSVIDLSKIDALIDVAGQFFREIGDMLRISPVNVIPFVRCFAKSVEYGDGKQSMRDFGSLLYNHDLAEFSRRSLRNKAIQALSDAVVYCVRGPGRSEAQGLTFCFPAGLSDEQLDRYAQNFPMPDYLAYLDAISSWTAPDWVYEYAQRLPEIDGIKELQIEVKKARCQEGMPGIQLSMIDSNNINAVYYTLYHLNEETGETVCVGWTDCIVEPLGNEDFDLIWHAHDPMHWPSVEGQLISMNLVTSDTYSKLYDIPVMMDSKVGVLRMGRHTNYMDDEAEKINEYTIYGLWEGYDENSTLLNRSVKPLSDIVGQEYQMLYEIDGTGGDSAPLYEFSAPLTMYRSLDVEEIALPAGTYYLEYEVEDVFMRLTTLERIEVHWDGAQMTFPGAPWESDEWINLSTYR